MLEVIYVVRHGYRSNWVVDPTTGTYSTNVRTPTGIPSDPALASYGVKQAEQLATHLGQVNPPVDIVYSSPFYRCLQTLKPFTDRWVPGTVGVGGEAKGERKVRIEPGLGEFYGLARFDHPSPAGLEVLKGHFAHLEGPGSAKEAVIVPSTKGESIPQLHDRLAYCLHHLIRQADADPNGPKSLLICSHAAAMIAIGRVLTGRMPEDKGEEDFKCFTCSFSKFKRKQQPQGAVEVQKWDPEQADTVPDVRWQDGEGVSGGWECEINGDCSFLEGGEERGWNFHMEHHRIAQLEKELQEEAAKATIAGL